jgi:hypothetical protein
MRKYFLAFTFSLTAVAAMAQVSAVETLIVPRGIRLPGDSLALIGSLRGWLDQRSRPDSSNAYVSKDDLPMTSVLMDELRSIDRSVRADSGSSCKCYLGNVVSLDSSRCLVQLNYMGMRKDTPMLRACCTVLARRSGDKWIVSSTLAQNTVSWKSKSIGNCTFHYKQMLNERKAGEFVKGIAAYDKILNAGASTVDFYCCDNWVEATALMGEDYRLEYNGLSGLEFSSDNGSRTVVVSGEPSEDGFNYWNQHDWWHGRLHRVVPVRTIYRPVDEGMAYLYGGSWRIYAWKDILSRFKDYVAAHPDADWLSLYKAGTDYVPGQSNLKISYVINALIVQRIGYAASVPLLTCGLKQPGDANYFAALKRVVSVDEAGFNTYVRGLIDSNEKH